MNDYDSYSRACPLIFMHHVLQMSEYYSYNGIGTAIICFILFQSNALIKPLYTSL